jgi:hypothetical protein
MHWLVHAVADSVIRNWTINARVQILTGLPSFKLLADHRHAPKSRFKTEDLSCLKWICPKGSSK